MKSIYVNQKQYWLLLLFLSKKIPFARNIKKDILLSHPLSKRQALVRNSGLHSGGTRDSKPALAYLIT
ncbi:hypothetical protein [Peribacillus frigoritolerans]|uniref:hypothetical protein n=1 Tax=Peribacillus frigoritolerans TaxID=450367 RepID=UPI0039A39971